VVVYAAFSPFAGSGRPSKPGGWKMSIDLRRGSRDPVGGQPAQPGSFDTSELYEHVRQALRSLNLPGLTLADRLYADGRSIRDDRWLLPDVAGPPISRVDTAVLRSFIDSQAIHARHYLCAQVSAWESQVFISVYLRFSKVGAQLRCEATYRFLGPIGDAFRRFESLPPLHSDLPQRATRALKFVSARDILQDTILMIRHRLTAEVEMRWLRYQARHVPTFNYGGRQSHREYASANRVDRLYQYLDREHSIMEINEAVLNSLVDFLDRMHIDTSALVKRTSTILNQGIIISNSDVDANEIVAGNNNRVAARDADDWSDARQSEDENDE
jgi:hypothetical protein